MKGCPDCGAAVQGAQVCGRCGAFDFEGLTSWVCFPCGAVNAHGRTRCECGRERTVECASCGADVPFAQEDCPRCGLPRSASAAADEVHKRSEEAQRLEGRARRLAILSAPVLALGLLLSLASAQLSARLSGLGLLGVAFAGEAYAFSTHRQARRRLD